MDSVRLALVTVSLGMETAWLFAAVALASLVFGMPAVALSPLAIGILVAGAWGVVWLLDHLDISLILEQLAGALIGVVAITLVAQASSGADIAPWDPFWFVPVLIDRTGGAGFGIQVLIATAGALFVWWRGVRLSQRDPGFAPTLFAFRLGLAFVGAEAVFEAFIPTQVGAAWGVVPYFTLGLMALALAHLEEIGRTQRGDAGRWLWLPPAVIVVMSLLAIGLALGVYSQLWNLLLTLLGYVDFLFSTALMAVLLALGLVAEVLITVLRFLISFVAGETVNPRMINFGNFLEELRLQSQSDPETLRRLTDVCKYIAMGIVGTVVVVWLARSLRRRGEREGQPKVQRGSLWSNRTFTDDMNELALALLGLVRRPKPAWAGLGDDPRGTVLRSYLMSLAMAEERGLPRPPWYTPAEYIPVMRSAFLESGPASSELTALFEVARYSNEPPTAEQGQTAVTLADSLSKTGAPEKRQEVTGAAAVQEQRPADELEIEWRAERMGG